MGKIHSKDPFIDKPHKTGTVHSLFRASPPSITGTNIFIYLLKDLLIRERRIQMASKWGDPPRALPLIAACAMGRKPEQQKYPNQTGIMLFRQEPYSLRPQVHRLIICDPAFYLVFLTISFPQHCSGTEQAFSSPAPQVQAFSTRSSSLQELQTNTSPGFISWQIAIG